MRLQRISPLLVSPCLAFFFFATYRCNICGGEAKDVVLFVLCSNVGPRSIGEGEIRYQAMIVRPELGVMQHKLTSGRNVLTVCLDCIALFFLLQSARWRSKRWKEATHTRTHTMFYDGCGVETFHIISCRVDICCFCCCCLSYFSFILFRSKALHYGRRSCCRYSKTLCLWWCLDHFSSHLSQAITIE